MYRRRSIEDFIKKKLIRTASVPAMLPSNVERNDTYPRVVNEYDDYYCELDIDEKLEDVSVQEHSDALLECKIFIGECLNPTCTWYKNDEKLTNDHRYSITSDNGWQRLEISRTELTDIGLYSLLCRHRSDHILVKSHLSVAPKAINRTSYSESKSKGSSPGITRHLNNVRVKLGGTIVLTVKFEYEDSKFFWFKNNNELRLDGRMTIFRQSTLVSLEISDAADNDVGTYFIVAKTSYGTFSSFADVQIINHHEQLAIHPLIEEHLPDEVEYNVDEEVRLICKAQLNNHSGIRWFKDDAEIINNDNSKILIYGNNYIGLTIPKCSIASAGEYKVWVLNSEVERAAESLTVLSVTDAPPRPCEVSVSRQLETVVACGGAKVSFDCSFNLEDPTYFYVVWYIGHYRVERTNSLFTVICAPGQYLLYIKNVEPNMAGEVICELRRAFPLRKSVMMARSYARLVIVPPCFIMSQTNVLKGKLFHETDTTTRLRTDEDLVIHATETTVVEEYQPNVIEMKTAWLFTISLCRLDDDGLYFAYVTHGTHVQPKHCRVHMYERTDGNSIMTMVNWLDRFHIDYWYRVEMRQPDGSFAIAGLTSQSLFEIRDIPDNNLMMFKVTAVEPVEATLDSYISIFPPPETVLKPLPPLEIQSSDVFDETYTITDQIIGSGAFGSVVLVKDNLEHLEYAAKIVKARVAKKRNNVLREYNIMKGLRHPKIIQLFAFFESKSQFIFVMEYSWGGELFDRVVCEEYLKEVDVVGYVMQICMGLHYLHRLGFVHLDLKPENIICINPNSRQVKLIDFGLARHVKEETHRAIYGTREYIAPEVIDYEPISVFSDMWSLGVVTYMLLSGLMPFAGNDWMERSVNITRVNYDYDDGAFDEISPLAKDFVDKLLIRRPESRLTAFKALYHPWVQEGPPTTARAKKMTRMRKNLKSYLAEYRSKWQRAGNVMIAAHRLRMCTRHERAT